MESKTYVEFAILGIIILSIILYIIWQIKKKGLKQFIVEWIVEAEENIENNEDKFNYVVEKAINFIPTPFNLFVTTEMVENIVQTTFDLVKKALDYKPEN